MIKRGLIIVGILVLFLFIFNSFSKEDITGKDVIIPRSIAPADITGISCSPLIEEINEQELKEKIAQMLILHINLCKYFPPYEIGGYYAFRREDLNDIKECAINYKRAFIASDMEGGQVLRFREMPERLFKFGSQAIVGEDYLRAENKEAFLKEVYQKAYESAQNLRSIGVNMNFAPVLDVIPSQLEESFIAEQYRSYGSDPEIVTMIGNQVIKGFNDAGIIAVAKHFPGMGYLQRDPHFRKGSIVRTREEIENSELVPFASAISNGVKGIMVGWFGIHAYDPDNFGFQSKIVVTDLLRNELDFDGLIITDEIGMVSSDSPPISTEERIVLLESGFFKPDEVVVDSYVKMIRYEYPEQRKDISILISGDDLYIVEDMVASILAGNDLLLYFGGSAHRILLDGIYYYATEKDSNGVYTPRALELQRRINESYQRILRIKQEFGLSF